MKEIFIVIMLAVLTNNYVLVKFMGVCPALSADNKDHSALWISLTTSLVMVASSAITWPIYHIVIEPNNLTYLRTFFFMLVIGGTVQLFEHLTGIINSKAAKTMGIYLPLITTNCAVLGLNILNITEEYSYVLSLANAVGTGIGFTVAMLMFSGIKNRIDGSDIPECFKGAPAALLAASIISLSFIGFTGLSVGLFGM